MSGKKLCKGKGIFAILEYEKNGCSQKCCGCQKWLFIKIYSDKNTEQHKKLGHSFKCKKIK